VQNKNDERKTSVPLRIFNANLRDEKKGKRRPSSRLDIQTIAYFLISAHI